MDIMPTDVTDVFCVLKCFFVVKSGLIDNSPEQCPPRIAGPMDWKKRDDRNRFRHSRFLTHFLF
jgi:hypothetical protein